MKMATRFMKHMELVVAFHFTQNIWIELQIGSFTVKAFQVDVGMLPEGHSALLGLDVLKKDKFITDLIN